AQFSTDGQKVILPLALIQRIVSDDVAEVLADVTLGEPVNGIVEVAGPEKFRLDELVRMYLHATGDTRRVVTDSAARYFGIDVDDRSLTPDEGARIAQTRFRDWLINSASLAAGH